MSSGRAPVGGAGRPREGLSGRSHFLADGSDASDVHARRRSRSGSDAEGVAQGVVERKNVSVVVLASDGATEAIRWNLLNAWPAEWRGAPLQALSQEVAIEQMRLVCDEMNRA